jgi:hypothetical protein
MKFEFSRQIFEKYSNTKFHEYSSSGSRSVPRGRPDRRTDITKLGVDFRNFTKAPIISSARKKKVFGAVRAKQRVSFCREQREIQRDNMATERNIGS